jgi:membrane fusion protein, multidrug efflux system
VVIASRSGVVAAAVLAVSLLSSGCGSSQGKAQKSGAPPPPIVSVIQVGAEDTPIYNDFSAQTYARDMVEVRGRVDGFIEKRLFQIGSDVQPGQVLYELDLRPYQADVAKAKGDLAQAEANADFARRQVALIQAQADLAQAEANLVKTRQDVDRLVPLVKQDAAAQQDLDNADAALKANQANVNAKKANVEQNRLSTKAQIATGEAQVESSKALVRTAELNLEYATIRAPIGGRIGDSLIQVGGLVTKTAAQPLTTIVPLDPIWVRFKVSEAAYLAFSERQNAEQNEVRNGPLQLVLADDRIHPYPGHFANTVNQVDPRTGTLELQATFPNPAHTILPGQFGRVRLRLDEKKGVILVPQRAIQELQGLQSVLTVGEGNQVFARSVVMGERIGERWIVEQGLKPGDRVIVEGLQKARPGSIVNPKPYQPPPGNPLHTHTVK